MADEILPPPHDWQEYWSLEEGEDSIRHVHLMVLHALQTEAAQLQDPLLMYLYDMIIQHTTKENPALVEVSHLPH